MERDGLGCSRTAMYAQSLVRSRFTSADRQPWHQLRDALGNPEHWIELVVAVQSYMYMHDTRVCNAFRFRVCPSRVIALSPVKHASRVSGHDITAAEHDNRLPRLLRLKCG